jgi:hypothetical protein
MNHLTEEELVLYHYGDAGDGAGTAAIDEHLHACPSCQAGLEEVRLTLAAVDQLPVPDRGDEYGAAVWARIQPGLAQPSRSWRDWRVAMGRRAEALRYLLLAPRRLAWAGAAAALFLAAFVAGSRVPWHRPDIVPAPQVAQAPPAASQSTAADRERVQAGVLLMAVSDHLDRSQVALSELVNAPGGPEVDISDEQQRARDLVSENRLYRQTALRTGEPAVASMLDDLERVLVEVANGPSTMNGAEFDQVRKRIDQQGIIFKVRVFGERVREAEGRPLVRTGIRG